MTYDIIRCLLRHSWHAGKPIKCSGKHIFLGEDGVQPSGFGNDVFLNTFQEGIGNIVNIWV